MQIQLRKPFQLVEEAIIKLKNRKIPLEPNESSLERSNRHEIFARTVMSGIRVSFTVHSLSVGQFRNTYSSPPTSFAKATSLLYANALPDPDLR